MVRTVGHYRKIYLLSLVLQPKIIRCWLHFIIWLWKKCSWMCARTVHLWQVLYGLILGRVMRYTVFIFLMHGYFPKFHVRLWRSRLCRIRKKLFRTLVAEALGLFLQIVSYGQWQRGNTIYILSYEECRKVIDSMSYGESSNVFGNEKDDSFKGSIGAIYQTFAGQEVYPSLEEKAANLLYFITKNHSFSDGNKRIAAAIFLYFMDRNQALFLDGEKAMGRQLFPRGAAAVAEGVFDGGEAG